MSPWRIILAATAYEASAAAGLLAVLAIGGAWSPWLDALTHLAPIALGFGLLAVVMVMIGLKGASRRIPLVLAAIGVAGQAFLLAPDLAARAWDGLNPAPAGKAPLTLLTFNAWTENFAPSQTVDAILKSGADVVALQEDDKIMEREGERIRAVYPYWAECNPSWACGTAILAKRPIIAKGRIRRRIGSYREDFDAIWAKTTAPDGRTFTLVATHFAWPIPADAQDVQQRGFVAAAHAIAGDDGIIAGDLNTTPWSFAMRRLDADAKPLVRRTHAMSSWPANVARLNRPFPAPFAPIDHIFAAPAWRTVSVERMARSGSDHYGVLTVLTRAPS